MPNKNFSALDSAASWIPQVLQNEAVIDMDPKRSLGIREIGVGYVNKQPAACGAERTWVMTQGQLQVASTREEWLSAYSCM
ncbi:hypothetical protein PMAA_039880 [Talaromyces marneffei ATCC 18224]|uniref:Uncharacterized protein n=1 Tax=Talaromyces marneffei (strain ATCC 18224 / CBS 334.59 / QM 7333) TaxID=441960 RepID=B6QQ05_TALMQ|nr:hypothetical protein PMAA_039880 [Talaromyces marneffei ATCC 18224]